MDLEHKALVTVASVGVIIGIGQVLMSNVSMTLKRAVGHALVTTGIAVSSFTVLAWIPDAPTNLLVGVSAALASLGTAGVSALAEKFLTRLGAFSAKK